MSCPTPDRFGVTRPLYSDRICDGRVDCAGGEDEFGEALAACQSPTPVTGTECCPTYVGKDSI